MSDQPSIRLLVADTQEAVRSGVKSFLSGTEIKVVAEANTGPTALKLALEKQIDIVLMGVCLPECDGLSTLGRIKLEKPALPVIMFSAFDNSANVAQALALGASGFLSKSCTGAELVDAIRSVAAGSNVWNRKRLRSVTLSQRPPHLARRLEVSLTTREAEVLAHITAGLANKEIALAMNIGTETVKEHVQNTLRKLGLRDRTQAAVWSLRNATL